MNRSLYRSCAETADKVGGWAALKEIVDALL